MAKNPYCGDPNDPNAMPPGRVGSYLQEVLDLSPAVVRGVGVTLSASLSSTSPSNVDYRVPGDQELVVFSIHGFLRFTALNSESTAILGWLNLDPSERWFVKSQNCTVALKNNDRSLDVFEGDGSIPMSAITPPVGVPMYFHPEAPCIFNAGHLIRATFTLQDSTSAIVSGATVYGIVLTGNLIPNRPA